MKRSNLTFFLLLSAFSIGFAAPKTRIDPKLVGSWGQNGETLYVFRADGTGNMEGDSFRWTADGRMLSMWLGEQEEKIEYTINRKKLILTMGGIPVAFEKTVRDSRPAQAKSAPKPDSDGGGNTQLSNLLLSSVWCSSSYNQVSGATNTKQVRFSRDGTWSQASRYEGYSSGDGGSMASQHDSESGGQWKVEGGRLYMSGPESGLSPVNLQVKKNSNNYPILIADGVEYYQCN